MRLQKILLPVLAVAAALLGAAALFRARPTVERTETQVPAPLIRVLEVHPESRRLDVESQGTVTPRTASALVAQVGGMIDSVAPFFADGGFFRRGDRLVRIDPRDYRLALSQAEAQVAQARVRLELEEAEAEMALKEWAELGRGEPGALTTRAPQLAEARAGLQAAEASLQQARLNLERTSIRAPFDGRVRRKQVDLGQFVAPGTPLAEIFSTDTAEIRLPVLARELAFLEIDLGRGSPGSRAGGASGEGPEVSLRGSLGGETTTWSGRVVRTGSQLDPRSRMLDLIVEVDDPFALETGGASESGAATPLAMGLFVDAAIHGRTVDGVVALPRSALRREDQVLVVDAESRLRFRPVDVLRLEGETAVIRGGLEVGERVCISPLETVVDGMEVRTQADVESGEERL